MTKHILTKDQRAAGLRVFEDDHNVYIEDTIPDKKHGILVGKIVAIFSSSGATVYEIQKTANEYLVEKIYQESKQNGGFRND